MSHYNSAYSSQPEVALVHSIYGEPVDGKLHPDAVDDGVSRAVGSYLRPYEAPKPPKLKPPKPVKEPGKRCDTEGCGAYATGTGHCVGHSRSLGLVPNWNKDGRIHEPE